MKTKEGRIKFVFEGTVDLKEAMEYSKAIEYVKSHCSNGLFNKLTVNNDPDDKISDWSIDMHPSEVITN